jgi:hypothetical protein
VNIDITSAPAPVAVSTNDTAVVELFDSSIWVDPAATNFPASVNVNSSTANVRLVSCDFHRSLVKGQTQQIRDVLAPLHPTLLTGSAIESLSSQTQFTLISGPPDNNALNGRSIVITDNADDRRKAVGVVSTYVGSTRQVTLAADPGIFNMAPGDEVNVIVEGP